VALASAEYRRIVDAVLGYFGIAAQDVRGRVYEERAWFGDFWLEAKAGGPGTDAVSGLPVEWWWFRRRLPWEPPSGPMTAEERLAWLASHGEKFYGMMHDSRSPRLEFRESRMAFEEAISLAMRLGRADQVARLKVRLDYIRASFRGRSQAPESSPQ